MLEAWIKEAEEALGVDIAMDHDVVLDVARVVAHRVERRAAPLTAYMMGLAVGSTGVDPAAAARRLIDRARTWESDDGEASTTGVE